ncbi:hypothetical protein I3843_14G034000 [Carya illinoinensis]|nr:hypothetical protein I3843_14G034000 [Carya illinoinensis]
MSVDAVLTMEQTTLKRFFIKALDNIAGFHVS